MPEQGLTIFKNGGFQVSKQFDNANLPTTGLDEGLGAGFATVRYKGGKWGIRYQGEYIPYQINMNGTMVDSPFLDVVLLKSAAHTAKAWYEGQYNENQSGPPDCYSSNSIVPDAASAKPQSKTCALCPHNQFGSKVNAQTGEAMKGKACQDMKRVAVVPVGDIENVALGGPMMLSVPPSSLKRLVSYQSQLRGMSVNYATVWTRVSFVKQPSGQPMSYPLMDFDAMAGLNDEQAHQVIKMLEHPLVDRILNTPRADTWDERQQQSQMAPATPAAPAAPKAQPAAATATPTAATAQPPDDGMAIPEHLRRTAPQQATAEAAQAPVLPNDPPPGVDPAQWEQFLAMQRAPQRKPRAKAAPSAAGVRTPPVSPQPTDSAASAAAQVAAPQGAATPAATPAAGPAAAAAPAAPGQAISKLMDTIGKMV